MASSSAPTECEKQIKLYNNLEMLTIPSYIFGLIFTATHFFQLGLRVSDILLGSEIYYLQTDIVNNAVGVVGGLTVIAASYLAEKYCKRKAIRLRFDRDNLD